MEIFGKHFHGLMSDNQEGSQRPKFGIIICWT